MSRPRKPTARSPRKSNESKGPKAPPVGAPVHAPTDTASPIHPTQPPIATRPPIATQPPIATSSPIGIGGKFVAGPGAVAGASITAGIFSRLDVNADVKAQLEHALADLLPGRAVAAGAAATDRTLNPDALAALIPSAAIVAAGLDPAAVTPPAPNALWRSGNQQLMIIVSKVRANFADGLVEIVVPVTCDQTGDVEISVSFITGTPDRPAGGIATTEDHPRGAAVVVENWADPLIAYAWQVLITATDALSNAGGSDVAGRTLITAGLAVSAAGVTVTPMARHTFAAGLQ
jgi:hypothetical protein